MRRAELTFALVIVLIMGGSWALDGLVPSKTAATPVAPSVTTAPLSEAWYCPAPTAQGLGSTVWTANLGTGPVHVRRSGTGASGATSEADLGAGTFGGLPAAPSAANVPVTVEAFGGATGSHVSVLAPSIGGATGRCSRQPGTRWLFPIASTAPGYDTYLLVTNPFLEEAVVTVRVLTDSGDQIPSGLSHVEIPQRSQTSVFLGDFFPQTASVGLDVTASRGRVVVGELMRVAARDGARGIGLDVGTAAPTTQWLLPGGEVPASGEEDIVVANPSDHEALVSTVYLVESGTGPVGVQDVPVPAGGRKALKVSDQVPGGTRHATILTSTNGVPVVVERLTVGPQGAYHTVQGVPATATRWMVAAGSTAGGTDTLALVADGAGRAVCRVTILTMAGPVAPAALAGVAVTPGQRSSVDLTPYLNGAPATVLVEAITGKVAVENDLALPAAYRETMETAGTPLG
jgi:hypothetical protein